MHSFMAAQLRRRRVLHRKPCNSSRLSGEATGLGYWPWFLWSFGSARENASSDSDSASSTQLRFLLLRFFTIIAYFLFKVCFFIFLGFFSVYCHCLVAEKRKRKVVDTTFVVLSGFFQLLIVTSEWAQVSQNCLYLGLLSGLLCFCFFVFFFGTFSFLGWSALPNYE